MGLGGVTSLGGVGGRTTEACHLRLVQMSELLGHAMPLLCLCLRASACNRRHRRLKLRQLASVSRSVSGFNAPPVPVLPSARSSSEGLLSSWDAELLPAMLCTALAVGALAKPPGCPTFATVAAARMCALPCGVAEAARQRALTRLASAADTALACEVQPCMALSFAVVGGIPTGEACRLPRVGRLTECTSSPWATSSSLQVDTGVAFERPPCARGRRHEERRMEARLGEGCAKKLQPSKRSRKGGGCANLAVRDAWALLGRPSCALKSREESDTALPLSMRPAQGVSGRSRGTRGMRTGGT